MKTVKRYPPLLLASIVSWTKWGDRREIPHLHFNAMVDESTAAFDHRKPTPQTNLNEVVLMQVDLVAGLVVPCDFVGCCPRDQPWMIVA